MQKVANTVNAEIGKAVGNPAHAAKCSCGGTLLINSIHGVGDISHIDPDGKLKGGIVLTWKCEKCGKRV